MIIFAYPLALLGFVSREDFKLEAADMTLSSSSRSPFSVLFTFRLILTRIGAVD
jgi:hypothetical protein